MSEALAKTGNRRDSNMELLRIVAMFMIVILHLDIFLLEEPHNFEDQQVAHFLIGFLKSLTIIGVNLFILLSGWYGIHFKWNRFAALWFQVLFFASIGLTYDFLTNGCVMDFQDILFHLFQMDDHPYWFFQSYIILYIFSPILNSFIQNTDYKTLLSFLCVFFILQLIWGCFSWGYVYFGNGYSALSFMGLYILARYAHLNQLQLRLKSYQWGALFLLLSIVSSLCAYWGHSHTFLNNFAYSYSSPLVIVSAFSVLALFSRLRFNAVIVNRIAIHCFAIYLFHMNYYILPQIINICTSLNMDKQIGLFIVLAPLVCMMTFGLSIVLDLCRLYIWDKLIMKYVH